MLISGIFRQMHIPILFRVNEYAKLARHICHIRIFKRIRICRPSSLCPVTSISNVCIFNIIVFNVVTLLCYYVCTLEQTWDLIVKPCAFFFFSFWLRVKCSTASVAMVANIQNEGQQHRKFKHLSYVPM